MAESGTDLNPLIPAPIEVILLMVACGVAALAVVGLVVFFAFRRSAPPQDSHPHADEQSDQRV